MADAGFFAQRPPGRPGLALFLNAGDPPLDVFADLVRMLDANRVDCLELAIPFPNSPTDGPVIRESADRALAEEVDTGAVLDFIQTIRPTLSHLKIALLADWSYSIKPAPIGEFLERVKHAGADGLLVHGLPPRLKQQYFEAARTVGQPIVTTCYANSDPAVIAEAAEHASAYIYLVAHYGRSGTVGPPDHTTLVPVLEALRQRTRVPVAVGFGVKKRADVDGLAGVGADAAIVGSAGVARVADALGHGHDVIEDFRGFLADLGQIDQQVPAAVPEGS